MSDVAIIGLGAMGRGMALRLAERGHAVRGWDVAERVRAAAIEAGVAVAEDAASGADIVILSLPNDRAVFAAAEGLPAAGMAADGVVLDTSTVAPATPRTLSPRFAGAGLSWVDAPVSGGPAGARAGTMTMMLGGDLAAITRAEPVIRDLAARHLHVGASGAGAVAKLANNLLVAGHMVFAAEALRLARLAGVEAPQALAVINGASGRSAATEVNFPKWILSGGFDSGFTAGLMRKDLRLAMDLAAQVGATGAMAEAVARIWLTETDPIDDSQDFNRVAEAVFEEESEHD